MPSPRQVNWAKFRITMLTIAALAILSVLVYLLTGGTLFKEKTVLFLYLPDATGIETTTLVRLNGLDVGKVSAVSLSGSGDPNRVIRVSLSLEQDYLADIPVDSFAQISADNPLGQQYVDITRGSSRIVVRPGGEIPLKPPSELFKNIDLREFQQRLRVIDALMSDIEQGKNSVGRLLLTDDLYNDLRTKIAGLEKVVRTAASATSTVGQLAYTDQLYRQWRAPFVQIDAIVARIQAGQGDLGRLLREDGQYRDLANQLAGLRQSIAGIREYPMLESDDLYREWNRALASFLRTLDEAGTNPSLITSDWYDNVNGAAAQMGKTLREFRRNPQKFLRLKP